jgi:hypothetical protein
MGMDRDKFTFIFRVVENKINTALKEACPVFPH